MQSQHFKNEIKALNHLTFTLFPLLITPLLERKRSINTMKNIFKDQKGQGVLEYILISSLVGIFCLAAIKQVGKVLQKRVQNLKSSITRELPLRK